MTKWLIFHQGLNIGVPENSICTMSILPSREWLRRYRFSSSHLRLRVRSNARIKRSNLSTRSEFVIAKRFCEKNGDRTFWYFALARWACIPFSLLGGWICYRWASEIYGPIPGITALVLWSFSPTILGWGSTITPDVAAAALGVTAGYTFWRWLQDPSWTRTAVAGGALGLAELTKTTWIVLFVLWPLLWLACGKGRPSPVDGIRRRHQIIRHCLILLMAVYIINLGYWFENTGEQLQSFTFISKTLGGTNEDNATGNRFSNSLLGKLWMPLPANYIRGIDFQKYEFEKGKWSYLCGEQRIGGWYYYYLFALLVKTPTGTLFLTVLAIVASICSRHYRTSGRAELMLLAPALVVLLVVSSQTGFNRYIRYVIPALPFIFIAISRVTKPDASPVVAVAAWLAIAASVISSLSVLPHSMSYFNYAVGGPRFGHHYLADANIDWGQDLLRLKTWMMHHPEATPMHLSYFGYFEPELAGITAEPVPSGPARAAPEADPASLGPQPGWYAISVNNLIDYHHFGPPELDHSYFREFEPVTSVGYSIYIYHISLSEANRVRRKLGLPELKQQPSPQ